MTEGKRPSSCKIHLTLVATALLAITACRGGDTISSRGDYDVAPDGSGGLGSLSAPAARAYLDPETGRLSAPPPSLQGGAAAGGRPAARLPIEPGSTAAGGVKVDLRGAFSYGLHATVNEEGRIATLCDPENAANPSK